MPQSWPVVISAVAPVDGWGSRGTRCGDFVYFTRRRRWSRDPRAAFVWPSKPLAVQFAVEALSKRSMFRGHDLELLLMFGARL